MKLVIIMNKTVCNKELSLKKTIYSLNLDSNSLAF